MAYNPPRTQQINTLRGLGGNFSYNGRVSGSTEVTRIRNSNYGAQQDVGAIARANAAQAEVDSQLLNNFVNFVMGDRVTEKIEGYLTTQAQNQVGEMLANEPDLGAAYRAGDADARATIANLNPKAQNLYEKIQSQQVVNNYLQTYGTEMTADMRLQDPSLNAEERAVVRREVKARVAEDTGLSAMQPYWLSQYAGSLSQSETAVDQPIDSKYRVAQKAEKDILAGDGLAGLAYNNAVAIEARNGQGTSEEDTTAIMAQARKALLEDITETGDEVPVMTRAEHFSAHLNGIVRKVNQLVAAGDHEGAETLVEYALELGSKPLAVDGVDYFSQRDKQGRGWNEVMKQLEQRTKGYKDKVDEEQFQEDLGATLKTLIDQGQGADPMPLIKELTDRYPEKTAQIVGALGQVSGFVDQPTPEQERAFTELIQKNSRPGISIAEQRQNISGFYEIGAITPKQAAQLYGRVSESVAGQDDRMADRAYSEVVKGENWNKWRDVTITDMYKRAGQDFSALTPEEQDVVRKRFDESVWSKLSDALNDKRRELMEQGVEVTDEMFGEIADELGQKLMAEYADEYANSANPSGQTPEQKEQETAQEDQTKAKEGRSRDIDDILGYIRTAKGTGKEGLDIFPPIVVLNLKDPAIMKGLNKNFGRKYTIEDVNNKTDAAVRAAQQLILNIMSQAQENVGASRRKKKRFPRPSEAYQKLTDPKYQGAQSFAGPAVEIAQTDPEEQAAFNFLAQTFPVDFAKATGTGGPTAAEESAFKLNPQNVLLASLSKIAGATPLGLIAGSPANAAEAKEGFAELENAENLVQFRRILTGVEQLVARSGPMPQINGNAVTKILPVAITQDTHPYFVAIGISEGTRDKGGGYTKNYYGHVDPADGNMNRGTVSGGRGPTTGMSPQATDRWWMGQLTKLSLRAAPVLKAMGIKPNSQVWHRAMYNYLDLHVQSPLAATSFLQKIPEALRAGSRIEAFAKIRVDCYRNPQTGKLESAFSYSKLLADQRSRAGSYDYKKRL